MNGSTLITLKNIRFGYSAGEIIMDGLDFELKQGDRIAISGQNGAGKTTLFHIILGLLKPTNGTITIFGKQRRQEGDFKEARKRIGLVFQDPDDQLFCPTVLEDVAFGPLNMGAGPEEAMDKARDVLDELGISHLSDRVPFRLSGGEKRIVSLATVLAMEPEVLLLDEPTTGLDQSTTERLMRIIGSYPLKGLVIISHDREIISRIAQKKLVFRDKKLAWMNTWGTPLARP